MWRDVARVVDAALVVVDTNLAAQPAAKGTLRPDDTGYLTIMRAFNLADPVDLYPIPDHTYSCSQRTARSLVDTVTYHKDAMIVVASYHCWGITSCLTTMSPLFHFHPHRGPAREALSPHGVPHTPTPPRPSGYGQPSGLGAPKVVRRRPNRLGSPRVCIATKLVIRHQTSHFYGPPLPKL